MRELTYAEAIREALREEMLRDERVFILGEDVGALGGIFTVVKGLIEEFGTRPYLKRRSSGPRSDLPLQG